MTERRQRQRNMTYLGGTMAFNAQNSTLNCLVRDLSQDGAKLELPAAAIAPPTFELRIRANEPPRHARIVWRTQRHVGVAFQPSTTSPPLGAQAAQTIRDMEQARQRAARRAPDASASRRTTDAAPS